MNIGRNIKIYLADGSVSGIRHAEIVNWTGQAISVPRTKIKKLSDWSESKRPGIYFLYGVDEESGSNAVYIGETENVYSRLQQHIKHKKFWNEAVFFTNKDENLTKAHVKYLESRLILLAKEASREVVINATSPPLPVLPRGDRDAMEEFILNLEILLGAVGHRTLQSLTVRINKEELKVDNSVDKNQTEVFYKAKNLRARAIVTDEGIVVQEGSLASKHITKSLSNGYKKFRQKLIDSKVLIENGDTYTFKKQQLFTSPSQASAIIVGYPSNGRKDWKTSGGKTIQNIEEEIMSTLSNINLEELNGLEQVETNI